MKEKQDIAINSNVPLTKPPLWCSLTFLVCTGAWTHAWLLRDPMSPGPPKAAFHPHCSFMSSCSDPLFDICGQLEEAMVPLEIWSRHSCTLGQFCGKQEEHFSADKTFYGKRLFQGNDDPFLQPTTKTYQVIMLFVECPPQRSLTFIRTFEVILLHK